MLKPSVLCGMTIVVLIVEGNVFHVTLQDNEKLESNSPKSQCLTLTTFSDYEVIVDVVSLYPDYTFTTTLTISKTNNGYICVDNRLRLNGTGISNKVIRVNSSETIEVMVHDVEKHSSDSYMAIPFDKLGSEYYVVTAANDSQLSITSYFNDTEVVLQFPIYINAAAVQIDYERVQFNNPRYLNFTLAKDEVLNIHIPLDLTGVFVSSRNPISVVAGSRKTKVGVGNKDHMAYQLPPVDQWGTQFITVPSPNKVINDNYRIISSGPNNTVSVDGIYYEFEKEGDWIELSISPSVPSSIQSEKAILVVKIVTGYGNQVDPCILSLIPEQLQGRQYSFEMLRDSNYGYLIIVIETEYASEIYLNDLSLSISNWIEVPYTNKSAGYIRLESGLFRVESSHSNIRFAAYIHQGERKYGFCSSLAMEHRVINEGWNHSVEAQACAVMLTPSPISPPLFSSISVPATSSAEHHVSYTLLDISPTPSYSMYESDIPASVIVSTSASPDLSTMWTSMSLNGAATEVPMSSQSNGCDMPRLSANISEAELDVLVSLIKDRLRVIPDQTSRAVRKRTSAPDSRASSYVMGITGWTVMMFLLLLAMLNDIVTIVRYLSSSRKRNSNR